jgi:hypothetical protein
MVNKGANGGAPGLCCTFNFAGVAFDDAGCDFDSVFDVPSLGGFGLSARDFSSDICDRENAARARVPRRTGFY